MVCNGKTKRTPSNSLFRGFSAVPVFRDVPELRCSGVFRDFPVFRCSGNPVFGVPGCSGMFRCYLVPGFSTCRFELNSIK